MATQRTSFAKLQRDRDKQAKAAAKRERRQNRDAQSAAGAEDAAASVDPHVLLEQVEQAHRDFDAGVIDFDTYEERKSALLAQLPVD